MLIAQLPYLFFQLVSQNGEHGYSRPVIWDDGLFNEVPARKAEKRVFFVLSSCGV
jgi:hypothetical protein